jgi:uroporphyrinogen-III synthase
VAESATSPLAGKRIVITRAAAQSAELSQKLSELGAVPVLLPLVSFAAPDDFAPMDAGLIELGKFDWLIFTSENAVRAVVERCPSLGRSLDEIGKPRCIAAVGPTTARAAEQAGFSVDYSAKTHSGVALANELGEKLRGQKVFLPRSDHANPDLPVALRGYGARVTEVVAYRTLPPSEMDKDVLASIARGQVDAILFFSPTAVQHFAGLQGSEQLLGLQSKLAIAAVGPITAAALQKAGVNDMVVATDTTAAAVVDALEQHFTSIEKHLPAGAKRG